MSQRTDLPPCRTFWLWKVDADAFNSWFDDTGLGVRLLFGEKVEQPRSTVGMAFQNPVLLEWRTILQNVMLPLKSSVAV